MTTDIVDFSLRESFNYLARDYCYANKSSIRTDVSSLYYSEPSSVASSSQGYVHLEIEDYAHAYSHCSWGFIHISFWRLKKKPNDLSWKEASHGPSMSD